MIFSYSLAQRKNHTYYGLGSSQHGVLECIKEAEDILLLNDGERIQSLQGAWLRSVALQPKDYPRLTEKITESLVDRLKPYIQDATTKPPLLCMNHPTSISLQLAHALRTQCYRLSPAPFQLGESVTSVFSLLALYFLAIASPSKERQQWKSRFIPLGTTLNAPTLTEYLIVVYEDYDLHGRLSTFSAGFRLRQEKGCFDIQPLFHQQGYGSLSHDHIRLSHSQIPADGSLSIICHRLHLQEKEALSFAVEDQKKPLSLFQLEDGLSARLLGTLAWPEISKLCDLSISTRWTDAYALLPSPASHHSKIYPLQPHTSPSSDVVAGIRFFNREIINEGDLKIAYPSGFKLLWRWAEGDAWRTLCELHLPHHEADLSSQKQIGLALSNTSNLITASLCTLSPQGDAIDWQEHNAYQCPSPLPWSCG